MNHCFEPGTVVPDLRSTDKFEALRELISRAPVFRAVAGRTDAAGGFCAAFAEAVIERERQQKPVQHRADSGTPRA